MTNGEINQMAAQQKNRQQYDEQHQADQQQHGQGRVAAGGYDKQGHPLTKDGHVDNRTNAENQQHDLHPRRHQSEKQDDDRQRGRNRQSEQASQGHSAAGGYDDDGHPLNKSGEIDKRVKVEK